MKQKISMSQVEENRFTGVEGVSIIKVREDGTRVRIVLTREGPKEYPLPKEDDGNG